MALRDLWDSDPRSKEQLREELLSAQKQLAFAQHDTAEWVRRYEALAEGTRDYSLINERLQQVRRRCSELEAALEQSRQAAADVARRNADDAHRRAAEAAIRDDRLLRLEFDCAEMRVRLARWNRQRRRLASVLLLYRSWRKESSSRVQKLPTGNSVAPRGRGNAREAAESESTHLGRRNAESDEAGLYGPDVVNALKERLAMREVVLKRTNDALRADLDACRATAQRREDEINRLRKSSKLSASKVADRPASLDTHPTVIAIRDELRRALGRLEETNRALTRESEAHKRARAECEEHRKSSSKFASERDAVAADLARALARRNARPGAPDKARIPSPVEQTGPLNRTNEPQSVAKPEESSMVDRGKFDDAVPESPLHILGYHVGLSSLLTVRERHALLRKCLESGALSFSEDSSLEYREGWGEASSIKRFNRIVDHLKSLIDGVTGQDRRRSQARLDWSEDLAWFQKTLLPADGTFLEETSGVRPRPAFERSTMSGYGAQSVVDVDDEQQNLLRLAFLAAMAGDPQFSLGRSLGPDITRFLTGLCFFVNCTERSGATRTTIRWRESGLARSECAGPINGWSLGWLAGTDGQRFLKWLESKVARAVGRNSRELELDADDFYAAIGPAIRRNELVIIVRQLGYSAEDDRGVMRIRWSSARHRTVRCGG